MTTTEGSPPPALVWHFDVISPYSYLALPRVQALAAQGGHTIRYNPVVLGAVLSRWGGLGPAEIGPKRLHTYRQCQFLAGQAGRPFRFPPRHPFRSLAVQRLLVALDAPPQAVATAFDFVWAEGRDVEDPEEYAALAERLGVADPPALVEASEAKALLRGATEAAIAAGVFGVPTLQVGAELFWGADAMPMAEAYLADPGLLARGEMARLPAIPVGVERRAG
jgi:2-hydroxychromene-2-carboxylate isomerase